MLDISPLVIPTAADNTTLYFCKFYNSDKQQLPVLVQRSTYLSDHASYSVLSSDMIEGTTWLSCLQSKRGGEWKEEEKVEV